MADDPFTSSLLWTLVLLIIASFLALIVCAQIISTYTTAYIAAPREIITFIDAVDFSIQENESYDRDVTTIPRLEDKLRLGRLLREIQKSGDDLREDLNRLVVSEGTTTIRNGARILWAAHRRQLEDRVRRLDLLRMRFLVVYMGIVAHSTGEREKIVERKLPKNWENPKPETPSKSPCSPGPSPPPPPPPPGAPPLPQTLLSELVTKKFKPEGVRLKSSTMGHTSKMGRKEPAPRPVRTGWAGVVEELQRSPLLRQRHASIEEAMKTPPPLFLDTALSSSPLQESPPSPLTPISDDEDFPEKGRRATTSYFE